MPATIEKPREAGVFEFFAPAATLRLDREAGVIHGVKILGLDSRNRRRYTIAALEAAAPLYDGAKVNVGHHPAGITAPRDYRDRLGVIKNVAFRPGEGLYGELHYNPKHPVAEQLAYDAEHNPAAVGLSPAHFIRYRLEGQTEIAEKIVRVVSVDLVADPATTKGLGEEDAGEGAADPPADPPAAVETTEQLAEQFPELVASIRTAAVAESLAAATEQATAALTELQAAGLPLAAADPGFLRELVAADAAGRKTLIAGRKALVKQIAEQTARGGPQSLPKGQGSGIADAKSFAAAIRR